MIAKLIQRTLAVCCVVCLYTSAANAQVRHTFSDLASGSADAEIKTVGYVATENESATTADTLAVCPEPFLDALQPWLNYRRRQGHRIHVIVPERTAYGLKRQIHQVAGHGALKNVVLFGDTPDSFGRNAAISIPTDYVAAELVRQFGSEPEIATDNTYSDLNDDGTPDLAIGRLPVDSAEQLHQQIRKIINYELSEGGQWQRRINLVAGTGGFGEVSDAVIERTSQRLISELIPGGYTTSMTYANWSSAYCPDPRQFVDTTLDRLNEGSLFWVYMGHGHPRQLDYVRTPIGGFPMFRESDVSRVNCTNGQPIALMLSCYTGAFDFNEDCLAEELLRRPGGPIAVVGGTRVTMPCGMSLLSVGLIEEYFEGQEQTLGQMLMLAKQRLLESDDSTDVENGTNYREMIQVLGRTLSPAGSDSLETEAAEHKHLFHLLGDPLLRVTRPNSIELTATPNIDQGTIKVTGNSPHEGQLMVELAYSRDRFRNRPPRRPEFKWDNETLSSYAETYVDSNQRTVASEIIQVEAGPFEVEIAVPEWAKGRCIVRGFVQQPKTKRFALGSSDLRLKRR